MPSGGFSVAVGQTARQLRRREEQVSARPAWAVFARTRLSFSSWRMVLCQHGCKIRNCDMELTTSCPCFQASLPETTRLCYRLVALSPCVGPTFSFSLAVFFRISFPFTLSFLLFSFIPLKSFRGLLAPVSSRAAEVWRRVADDMVAVDPY